MKTDFLTPVGRLVQGDPFEAQTKNMQGQPLMTKSGQPTQKYFIAVAYQKTDPLFPEFYAKLQQVARADFPALFDAAGNCTHPRFSWKVVDGDGRDDNGKSNALKEGFAGCWVVKFSSSFAPRCFHAGHYAPHEQIQDPKAIQRGYYVRVSGTVEGNGDTLKPGLYVNLGMLELSLARPDLIITSGPDASAVFGGAPAALPAGVPAAPAGLPQAPQMPGFTPPGLPAAAAPGLPQMPASPAGIAPAPMSPSNPVAPNPAFLAGPPVAAPAPTAPPPPAAPQMTAAAGGFTYEQYRALGWTEEQMRALGWLA